MPRKTDRSREIDKTITTPTAGGENIGPPTTPTAGPAVPTLPPPTNLVVASNALMFSAVTPLALIGLTWDAPVGVGVASYLVEAATNAGFTTGLVRRTVYQASASLELPTGTLYYFRVSAITAFTQSPPSATVSATTTTDTSAPAVPTSLAAAFNAAGDLEISWVNPTSTNFRDVEVSIYADSGFTTLLFRTYTATQRLVWTAAQNRLAGSGTPDPAVFVRMASRSWAGVLSSTAVPGTQPVKSVPANVSSLTQSWSGDTGSAGADLVITWAAATGASFYRLTIDGVSRDVFGTRYTYPLDQNTSEHSGTPDPVLGLSIVGVDGLDQVSASATTATATNAAPAAPSLATLIAAPGLIAVSVTATEPPDFLAYRFRIIQTLPSAADVTVDSQSKTFTYTLAAAATYQVGVRVVDRFGQTSSEALTGSGVLDLTIATLRAEAVYSDSASTAAATLKAALADDVRGSGGISYTSSGSERWIRFSRALTERYRYVTLDMVNVSGSASWYIRTSNDDGATWSYYAGPVTSSRILTAVANQAAAQAARVAIGTLGSVAAGDRVEFPATIEARYIEVYWLNSTGTTRVDEFYPRRLVEADDIRAQNLAAISADLGTITAGTITGATIQTATSGARIELTSANGLRSYDSSNVLQTQIRTSDGALQWGAGTGTLNAAGMSFVSPSGAFSNTASIRWLNGAVNAAQLSEYHTASLHALLLYANADGSTRYGAIDMRAAGTTSNDTAFLTMEGERSGSPSLISLFAQSVVLGDGTATVAVDGGISLNGATAAGTGGVWALRGDGSYQYRLERTGTNARTYGLAIESGAGSFVIDDITGVARIFAANTAQEVGFPTAVATSRMTLTGKTSAAGQYAIIARNLAGSNLFYAENNGTLWANVAWTISDAREKSDITDLDPGMLNILDSLRVRRYQRTITGVHELGFVAQEVQAVYPAMVAEGLDGVLGIRGGDIVALLVARVQELTRKVQRLEQTR